MTNINIITPVKNSLSTTIRTIENIMQSEPKVGFDYTVFNDFSDDETSVRLQQESIKQGLTLINLKDVTTHPSPNYLLILQMAQKRAIECQSHLLIIESDVIIHKNTVAELAKYCEELKNVGMVAAVTTDVNNQINFPYLYAKKFDKGVVNTQKRLSFCCTLLSYNFLKSFNFDELNPEKSWYDVFISHKSIELGFNNYLITSLPVLHLPHSSRPWKLMKYSNPLKYYWRKLLNNKDKI